MQDVELIPDGLHPYLDEWRYRKDPACAVSDIKEMRHSPAHYYSKKFGGYRPQRSGAQEIGTLVHLSILEPDRFASDVVLLPADAPTKPTKKQREAKKPSAESVAAIEWWDNWDKENGNKQIVDPDTMAQLLGIRDSVLSNAEAKRLIDGAVHKELAMFHTADVNGVKVRVKGKADLVGSNWIADLKTVDRGYANPHDFGYAIEKWGYHMQAAWYHDLHDAIEMAKQSNDDPFSAAPSKMEEWYFIVIEKEPPFDVAVMRLDADDLKDGRSINAALVGRLAECIKSDSWPGRMLGSNVTVSRPRWKK